MDETLLAERFETLLTADAGTDAPAGLTDLTADEQSDLDLLLRLARSIPPATRLVPGPDPDFVTTLGVRLREEAHRRSAGLPVADPEPVAPARRLRLLPGGGRAVRWAGGLVAALLLAFGVLGIAARQALPGDLLYPVKQLLDRIAVQVSGGHYDQGMTWLAQAEQHIGEARELADSGAPRVDDVTGAYASATTAVRNAERELALDWRETHADRARLALPDFAATALPLLDSARPSVPEASVPAWQRLRDLLAPYAAMQRSGTISSPGSLPTDLPTGVGTTGVTGLPTGTATPSVTGSATSPLVRPPVLPSATVPLPTVPLPTATVPLPTATVPLPTVSVPLPTVSIPLPTITLSTATVTLPTVSIPLPTVSISLPTVTLSLPLPTPTLPGLAPRSR